MVTNLIVGAGPVGLAAALFIAHARHTGRLPADLPLPRLIDAGDADPIHSRALAVNPRTLEILDSVGVTRSMLALGRRIVGAQLWRDGKPVARPDFAGIPAKYGFMLALSQAESVRLLREAYERLGGTIERNTKLVALSDTPRLIATIDRNGIDEQPECGWLLAADGARSTTRHALNIAFEGSTLERLWDLIDVSLDTDLDQDRAHVFFLNDEGPSRPAGFLFLLRVVDRINGVSGARDGNLWRVMGNVPELLSRLPRGKAAGEPVWVSSFRIGHRLATALSQANAYLAGDAAHIHSPFGARGMNLGIEDAYVFANLLTTNRLGEYEALRRPVDRSVVRRIGFATRVVVGESSVARAARRLMPTILHVPTLERTMLRMISGLDHPLPVI